MTVSQRRAVGIGQLVLGGVTVARPDGTVRTLTFGRGAVPDRRIVQVLGARQVAQGVLTLARPRDEVTALGSIVDLLHAGSLLPLIVFSRRYRAAALVSTLLAGGAAIAGAAATP